MSCLVTKTPWVAQSRGCLSSLSICSGWLSPCPQWAPEAAAILCTRDSGRQKKRDCFLPCSSICQRNLFQGVLQQGACTSHWSELGVHYLVHCDDPDQLRVAGICPWSGDNIIFHKHVVTWRRVPGRKRAVVDQATTVGPKYTCFSILLAKP